METRLSVDTENPPARRLPTSNNSPLSVIKVTSWQQLSLAPLCASLAAKDMPLPWLSWPEHGIYALLWPGLTHLPFPFSAALLLCPSLHQLHQLASTHSLSREHSYVFTSSLLQCSLPFLSLCVPEEVMSVSGKARDVKMYECPISSEFPFVIMFNLYLNYVFLYLKLRKKFLKSGLGGEKYH